MSGASRTSQPAANTAWNIRHKAALQTNNDFVVKNRHGAVKPREYNVYINKAYNIKQDKNGTKEKIPASDIIKYEGEKGGNTADYYNVYDIDDQGNLSLVDNVRIKREKVERIFLESEKMPRELLVCTTFWERARIKMF